MDKDIQRDTKELQTVYYAHAMSWYGTPGEADDVAALRAEGFDVVNPNDPRIEKTVQFYKARGGKDVMAMFRKMVRDCDALAYRPLTYGPGLITAGVAVEIMEAVAWGKPVFRLSGGCNAQVCSPVYLTQGVPDWSAVVSIAETRRLIREKLL